MNLFDELGFFMLHSAGGETPETVRGIGVLAIVSALAQDAISVKAFGKTEQYLPIESDNTTDYPNTLTGWKTYVFDGTEDWKTGSSLGSTIYFTATSIGCLYNSSSNRRIYNENYLTADTLPASSARHGYVLRGNSASDSWIGFGEVDDYTPTTWKTYLTTHPQTVLFPLHASDGSTWQAVKRASDDKFGYLCTSGTEKGTFVGAKGMNGTVAITPLTRAEVYCNNGIITGIENLIDVSESRINTLEKLLEITKPTYSAANVYVSATDVGGEISFSTNAKGIAIPCNVGESFSVSNFGTISTARRYYAEVDSNGVILVSRTSYNSGATITVSDSNTKYLLIEWTTDTTDNSQTVVVRGSTAPSYYVPYQAPETITDGTSSVYFAMLNKCGDYTDVQDAITGTITRNCRVLVLDGTEDWTASGGKVYASLVRSEIYRKSAGSVGTAYCNIAMFNNTATGLNSMNTNEFIFNSGTSGYTGNISFYNAETMDKTRWTGYLAEQYANGTPVVVVLPRLNNPTTESATPQTFPVPAGNSTAVISGSIADLEGEITYMKG